MNLLKNTYCFVFAGLLVVSCSTNTSPRSSVRDEVDTYDEESIDTDVSSSAKSFSQSLSNNRDTSLNYSEVKAAEYAQGLAPSVRKLKGRNKLLSTNALLASYQLSSTGLNEMLVTARSYAVEVMSKNINASLPESALLNLTIGAIKRKNYALAENYLDKLRKSKRSKTSSAAYTLAGLLNLISNKVPEAVLDWKKAVKLQSSNQAAKLNLGFIALKYGRYDEAKKYLSSMQNDWFALSGLSIAAFMLGDVSAANNYCKRSISKKSNSKMTLFNCGVQSFLAKGDSAASKRTLQKALKAQGATRVDEKIYSYLEKIERSVMDNRRAASLQKAKAAAAARAAKAARQKAANDKAASSAKKPASAKPSATKAVEENMNDAFEDEE